MSLDRIGFCLYDTVKHYRVRAVDGEYLIQWESSIPPTHEQIAALLADYYQHKTTLVKKFL